MHTARPLRLILKLTALLMLLSASSATATAQMPLRVCQEVKRFDVPEATQGVAVDDRHFYAIANSVIGKYDKQTGERVGVWKADDDRPLKHLNAGFIVRSPLPTRGRETAGAAPIHGASEEHPPRLWCAHSNFPRIPSTSSVEVWNLEPLEHVATQSFGVYEGSLTWIDFHESSWWAVFAHYSPPVNNQPGSPDHRSTSLVRFDEQCRRLEGWTFPDSVLERFAPHSSSGGAWGPDGKLYVTGHDRQEMYVLELPQAASTLRHVETLEVPMKGQAFVFDRTEVGTLYGIDRSRRQVVVSRLPDAAPSRPTAE